MYNKIVLNEGPLVLCDLPDDENFNGRQADFNANDDRSKGETKHREKGHEQAKGRNAICKCPLSILGFTV